MPSQPDSLPTRSDNSRLWAVTLVAVAFGVLSHVVTLGPLTRDGSAFVLSYAIALIGASICGYLGSPHTGRWCFIIGWTHAVCVWIWLFGYWLAVHMFGVSQPGSARYDDTGLLQMLAVLPALLLIATVLSLPGTPFAYAGARLRQRHKQQRRGM